MSKKVIIGFMLFACFWLAFAQTSGLVFADTQLPATEQQALNEWPNWVATADSCSTAASPTVSAGSGAPDGAAFPNLDPTAMATSIDNFIQKENPNSALKGLGATIVASAKNSNINPFLIVAIAHKESSLADPSDFNVSHGNNSFGREATSSQPHFQGSHTWYKWSSVKASVDYNAPENQNAAGGGDMATYLHDQYGNSIASSDLVSLFLQYAPPSENNTTQYISDVKGWVSDMVNGAGSATNSPTTGTPATGSCSCSASSTTLTGSDPKEQIYNYFVQPPRSLTPAQAAGIDGNFGQESGYNSSDPGGYLAQWGGSRFSALQAFAQKQGKPETDLGVQLDFVWLELTNGPGAGEDDRVVLQHVKAATTPEDAAYQFMGVPGPPVYQYGYERPGIPQLMNRQNYAKAIFQQFGSLAPGSGSPGCSTSGSQARQQVVQIAQQELALWDSGKMSVGFRKDSPDSYTKYSQNSQEPWCADFASWVYNQAGYPLQPGSGWRVGLVANIQSIGEQNTNFHWHPVTGYTPKPGDFAIHGSSHVNIVTDVSGTTVTLVGGDQHANAAGAPNGTSVSQYKITSFDGDGTTGYVSPD
jgi:hypothetical protein